jgi:hypothetical protein
MDLEGWAMEPMLSKWADLRDVSATQQQRLGGLVPWQRTLTAPRERTPSPAPESPAAESVAAR